VVSGWRVDGTSQLYEPVFATLSAIVISGTTLLEGPRSRIREMLPVQMQLVKPGSQVRAGKDELTLSSGCPGDGIGRASGD
jgi:hypothetical protein